MKGTNYNPFVNEHFIGFINQVTPQGVKVHFPSSALLQPFFKYGELYHGGLVGNYVVIEGHQMGFLGKIQGIELPEKERLELSEKSFETNEMHPIGYIEILLSFSFENPEEIQRGLNTLPPIGAKVFVCASYFIQSFFKRFGVKKENTAPCLMKLGVLTQDKTTPVEISLDALFGRHCAIVGTTGGGKSYTTSKLLEGISNAKAKAIIIDPTGEYSDQDDIAHTLKAAVKTKKTELLFLALMMRMLQSGGRCASIVPDTVLTGDAQAYKTIRSALVDKHCMQAVITMPSGVFQPYSGVSTAIIIFTKTGTGGTDKVWFYDMRADGFSLTTQRTPQPEQNDIPDIISRFHNLEAETDRSRKEQSFFVTADEIRANGYDLSYKRYHEVEREVIEYEAPETIIARMEERQKAIDAAFAEFKKLLNS